MFSTCVYLFPHWLWVGHSCGKESVPLQSPVKPRPVVMSVACVWEAPRDESAKLLVCWITRLSSGTRAHASQISTGTPPILFIVMSVFAEAKEIEK